jgi:hypothetical protein
MRKWLVAPVLVLAVAALTACTGKPKVETGPVGPSLAEVQRHAAAALDEKTPGQQRQQERNEAMNALLAFLRRPESTAVKQAEWEQPLRPESPGSLRYFESGKIRVYGLTIPASGVVPPGERVAVQFVNGGGPPQAFELEVLPGGQLVGAASIDDKALVAAFGLSRGGGYVAHFARDPRSGEFKPDGTPFRALPPSAGDVRLEMRREFLLVDVPQESAWRPQFDKARQGRFYVNADIALDWKGKYEVLDERSYTAFDAFLTALGTTGKKEERTEAWEKATRKLPAYLQQMESLSDSFTDKLPPGAFLQEDQGTDLFVRIVSIPAPDFAPGARFTVIQSRSGNGMPTASVLDLPGTPEAFRVVSGQGQPGIELLAAAPGGKGKLLGLLRPGASGEWQSAPEWFGFMPAEAGDALSRPAGSATLAIAPPYKAALSPDGSVQVCSDAGACLALRWVGGKLSAAGWVTAQLQQVAGPQAVTAQQVTAAAAALKQYMLAPETADLSGAQLAAALQVPTLRTWDLANRTRVIALPVNSSGLVPILVQAGPQVLVESVSPQVVQQWVDVRAVTGGTDRWLVLLGRTAQKAGVLLYRWGPGETWVPADAIAERVDKTIGEWSKISYVPGQAEPVRGLYVTGGSDLKAYFTADGQGVALCENGKLCTTYKFDQRWVLK